VAKIALSPLRRVRNLPRPILDSAVRNVPEIIADPAEMAEDRGVIVATPPQRAMVRK